MNIKEYYLKKILIRNKEYFYDLLPCEMLKYNKKIESKEIDEPLAKEIANLFYVYNNQFTDKKELEETLLTLRNDYFKVFSNKKRLKYFKETFFIKKFINKIKFRKQLSFNHFKNMSLSELKSYIEYDFINNSTFNDRYRINCLIASGNVDAIEYIMEQFFSENVSDKTKNKLIKYPLNRFYNYIDKVNEQELKEYKSYFDLLLNKVFKDTKEMESIFFEEIKKINIYFQNKLKEPYMHVSTIIIATEKTQKLTKEVSILIEKQYINNELLNNDSKSIPKRKRL